MAASSSAEAQAQASAERKRKRPLEVRDAADLCAMVKYFAQTTELNCGPTCLRMATATVGGSDPGIEEVERISGIQESKVITTLELALGAAKLLGREAAEIDFYSTSPGFNEANMQHSYYQRYNAASANGVGAEVSRC